MAGGRAEKHKSAARAHPQAPPPLLSPFNAAGAVFIWTRAPHMLLGGDGKRASDQTFYAMFIFWVVEPSDSRARFPLRAGITFGLTSERTDLGAIKHKLTKLDPQVWLRQKNMP